MNLYARLSNIKADQNISGATKDAALLRLIERISRAFDDLTHRHFYNAIATRYYDGDGGVQLWLRDDILSITTLKVDKDEDDVFETTVAETDYRLWPYNAQPKRRIDLVRDSASVTAWPLADHSVEIEAEFGFSNDTELTGATVADNPYVAGATTLNLTTGGGDLVDVGEAVVIEGEQFDISAISTDALTVVPGLNGTAQANHAQNTAVYRRRYPAPIEEAVVLQAIRMLREQQTGHSGQVGGDAVGGWAFQSLYPAIRDLIKPYILPVVA